MNKIELNQAIESLIASRGEDGDAARLLIKELEHIQPLEGVETTITIPWKHKDTFTGQTEYGNVSVKDEKDENKKKELTFNKQPEERVGWYKITKEQHHAFPALRIQHFWNSGLRNEVYDSKDSRRPYLLAYQDGEPVYFGVERRKRVLHIPFLITWGKIYLEILSGVCDNSTIGRFLSIPADSD